MTNQESAALMTNDAFRGRVQVCCVKYADSINTQNSSAIGHVSLENWAKTVFTSPVQVAMQVQNFVVMDPAVQAAGVDENGNALIEDPALQGSVEAVVNKSI
jgi:hypothetical protein